LILASISGWLCRAADPAGPAPNDTAGGPIKLAPVSVGGVPVMSFGFGVQIVKNGVTKKVVSMLVSGVAHGSQAEQLGLAYYSEILSIDGIPVENFTASFASGTELNQKLMNRKQGDRVTLEIVTPGARAPRFITLTQMQNPDRFSDHFR
jgi:S1-C subfamily serine protease